MKTDSKETQVTQSKPATALPWRVAEVQPARFPAYPIKSGDLNVAKLDIHARGGSHQDAAYIVAACNAYPELVRALKNIERDVRTKQDIAEARALLRKIGEAS